MTVPFPMPYAGNQFSQPVQPPQQPMYSYNPAPESYPARPTTIQNAQAIGPSIRMIANESEINVGDIPMDGQVHTFILKDYSKIIGKMWTAQGEIATTVFVPMQPEAPKEAAPQPGIDKEWIEAKFERLENMILESSTKPDA